jgi:hypothetical protein
MKKILMFLITLMLLIMPIKTMAVGTHTCVVVGADVKDCSSVTCTWTADASDGSVPTAEVYGGCLVKAITDPGTTAPTDNYDITLVEDTYSTDVSDSLLLNRDTANTEEVEFVPAECWEGTADLTIANNSVNSATGAIWLLICH